MNQFEKYEACKELIAAEINYYKDHRTIKAESESYVRLKAARSAVESIDLPKLVCQLYESLIS